MSGNLASSVSTTNDELVSYTNDMGSPMEVAIQVEWFGTVGGDLCNVYTFAYSIDFDNSAGDLDMFLWEFTGDCTTAVVVAASTTTSNYEDLAFDPSGSSQFVVEVCYFPTDGGSNTYTLTIGTSDPNDLGETVCRGVGNSANGGGDISAIGSLSASANQFTLRTQNLPPNTFGFYSTSRNFGFTPNPAGSLGNLCLGPANIGRFVRPGQIINSGPSGVSDLSPNLTTFPEGGGTVAVQSGETWYFQLWYRDIDSNGGAASNFSAALRVRFQ